MLDYAQRGPRVRLRKIGGGAQTPRFVIISDSYPALGDGHGLRASGFDAGHHIELLKFRALKGYSFSFKNGRKITII